MNDHDAMRIAALVVWEADRLARKQQRRDEKRAEYEWNVEEGRRQNEECRLAAEQYFASPEYARREEAARIENEKREQNARQIIDNPTLDARDWYLIEQLMAIGLAEPTYYANNTFAFFLDGKWVVWRRKDQFLSIPYIEVGQCDHPQMEEINQAVAGWRKGQYKPPGPFMTALRDEWRKGQAKNKARNKSFWFALGFGDGK